MAIDSKKGLSSQAAMGTLLAGSLALAGGTAVAAGNPFAFTDLPGGYMLTDADTGNDANGKMEKGGEGSCGGKAANEAVCGMYQVGSTHTDDAKVKDGKCGGHKVVEALCGGDR